MTVPFILAMGVGVANIRSDSRAEADSFGLVALLFDGSCACSSYTRLFTPARVLYLK